MQRLTENIISYLDYLEKELKLCISVHFSIQKLRNMPKALFSELLPYNVHKNPYCSLVKKDCWAQCIAAQQEILSLSPCEKMLCRTCHAGVQEYLYHIQDGDQVAGYVAVSGYLGKHVKHPESAVKHLHAEFPSESFLEAVIPPLCRMFELLFTYPTEEKQGEHHLMLRFLHERHGQVTLEELCSQFSRSKSYVSHLFNEECGMSLPAYCNNLKLEHARTLLDRNWIPITSIAMDVGYNDVSYFIQKFKEKYGLTPLQYRKRRGNYEKK